MTSPITRDELSGGGSPDDTAKMFAAIAAPRLSPPLVYPGYIAFCIKQALKSGDPEAVIQAVGIIETVGDCKYAIPVTDFNGSEYRITIEVSK